MRRLTLLPLLILPLLAAAQEERPAWSLPIEEVPVVTRRTMKRSACSARNWIRPCCTTTSRLDGRRADAERQPLHQELRPCHARDGRIPRHVALAHAGDVERDADQLADARHGRLLDDPRVLHRRRDAAARRLVDRRHGRRTGRRRRARHPPVRAAGLANAIRAGRRIVLDLRPIPARKLRRPAVERLDARGLLHLGQRLPLHQLRQDGARLRLPTARWSTPTTPSSATAAATSATCTCCRNSTTIAATARATAFRRGTSARNAGCPSSRPTTATT